MAKRVDWKLIGQWISIGIVLLIALLRIEHRMTAVEAAITEQMKGYTVVFAILTERIDRLDNRIEHLVERNRR